jgi:hypothetical protein
MRRTLVIPAVALLAAAPAAAQPNIQPGQTVTGELSDGDSSLDDKSLYDVWRFRTEPEHMYHVVLRSDDFDAMLAVGPRADESCDDCTTDDDGAGGTDAELRFTPGAAGVYEIRANAYAGKGRGRYTLTLEDEGALPPPDTVAGPGGVVLGVPATGRLEATDDHEHDGSYLDTYTYRGRRGETLVITLRSADFDAYLRVGEVESGGCRPVQGDDNGGGGRDSRMRVRLPNDGDFHIHVSSRRAGETGAYTLSVVRG